MSEYPWGQVSVDSQDNGLISICCDVSRSCNALAKRWTASYSNDVSVCESHTQRDVIDIGDTVHIRYFAQSDWMEGFKKCWRAKKLAWEKSVFSSRKESVGEKSCLNIAWYPNLSLYNMFFFFVIDALDVRLCHFIYLTHRARIHIGYSRKLQDNILHYVSITIFCKKQKTRGNVPFHARLKTSDV